MSGCVTNCRQWQFVRVEKTRLGHKYQKTDVHTLTDKMDTERGFILSFFYTKPEVLGTVVSCMLSTIACINIATDCNRDVFSDRVLTVCVRCPCPVPNAGAQDRAAGGRRTGQRA